MQIISKEIQLDYKNEIGINGIKDYYRYKNRASFFAKFNLIISLILIISWFMPVYIREIIIYICIPLLVANIIYYNINKFKIIKFERFNIQTTEIIETNEFDHITATIVLNEDYDKFYILKSYDKNNNLLCEMELPSTPFCHFSENNVASLKISSNIWELYFPKSALTVGLVKKNDMEE